MPAREYRGPRAGIQWRDARARQPLIRYRRMSSRKRSPKAIASTPSSTARWHASSMAASYCWFVQGQGSGTSTAAGRPAAPAHATDSRRAVHGDPVKGAFTVVSSPTTSYSPCCRSGAASRRCPCRCSRKVKSGAVPGDEFAIAPQRYSPQCLVEIRDQVLDVLDADRNADHAIRDADLRRPSSPSEAWVIDAGCEISVSTPPSDSPSVQTRTRFRNALARSFEPART